MVPKGWSIVNLKDIVDGSIKNGFSPNPAERDTGYWVLGLGALGDNGLIVDEIKPVEPTKKVLDSCLMPGDFLISRSNTPDKVGRSALFKGEIKNCSYPDLMMRFRIDERIADATFVESKLTSHSIRNYYKNCAAGSSSTMVKINKPIVEKTPLLLPPLLEQKKIARILSTWDMVIEVTEKILSSSQQQRKSLMQQLLTGKKRFPDFSGKWEEIRLKTLLVECKERNKDNAVDRVLSVTNHSGFVLPENQFSKRVASDDVGNYKIIKKGQFGYNPSRINVGSFARLDAYDLGILSPMYVVFGIKENKLNSDYFLTWMSSNEAKQRVLSSTQGSVRNSVGFNALCSFPIKLPPLEEQQKISSVLSAADKEIEVLHYKLDCLKQEKKALMQQLLTGKCRVKVDEKEISQQEAARA